MCFKVKDVMFLPILMSILLCMVSCRTPSAHVDHADNVASNIIAQYQMEGLDRTEPFTINRPSDLLRQRLMSGQELPGLTNALPFQLETLSSPFEIDLISALQIAARNSRDYQSEKESVFQKGLSLDLARDAYRNSYAGMLSSLRSNADTDGTEEAKLSGNASASLTRKLKTGASFTTKIGIDLVKLLTMDKTSSLGIFADATVSIPLLKGAWNGAPTESLTQAEKNMLYAILEFERFKRSFAVSIASEYLAVIEQHDLVRNADDNYKMIVLARERAAALAAAGRLSETQVDQAKQDELRANNRLISAKRQYSTKLDTFKVAVGLPPDAEILLDPTELSRLAKSTRAAIAAPAQPGATAPGPCEIDEETAVRLALTNRLDLRVAYGQMEDARRKVGVSRDDLRAETTLTVAASTREDKKDKITSISDPATETTATTDGTRTTMTIKQDKYSLELDIDLPWERTKETIAYRHALIALDSSLRAVEAKEDNIKLSVRSILRALNEKRQAYRIQTTSVKLAEKRIESTEMFLRAGRAEMRDLLEAQEALVSARNSLVSTLVAYRLSELDLQRDMGVLQVNEKGLWNEYKHKK